MGRGMNKIAVLPNDMFVIQGILRKLICQYDRKKFQHVGTSSAIAN